jgi:hypothetical protein
MAKRWRSVVGVLFALAPLLGVVACGGNGTTPTAPGGTATSTFTGTTSSNAPGSCTGDSHRINASQGTLTVTLVQTAPSVPLIVQLCAPGAVDHTRDCTINRTRMEVGQSLSGTLRGGSVQELAFNPLSCGGGAPPPPTPINYTASVLYPR